MKESKSRSFVALSNRCNITNRWMINQLGSVRVGEDEDIE